MGGSLLLACRHVCLASREHYVTTADQAAHASTPMFICTCSITNASAACRMMQSRSCHGPAQYPQHEATATCPTAHQQQSCTYLAVPCRGGTVCCSSATPTEHPWCSSSLLSIQNMFQASSASALAIPSMKAQREIKSPRPAHGFQLKLLRVLVFSICVLHKISACPCTSPQAQMMPTACLSCDHEASCRTCPTKHALAPELQPQDLPSTTDSPEYCCECRPGTVPPTSFNTWYVRCPEGLLQLLMPCLATSRIRKLYYRDTPRRRPQMIRAEWLAWVQNAPWVVQALMVQVRLLTATCRWGLRYCQSLRGGVPALA